MIQTAAQSSEWASSAAASFGYPNLNPMQQKAVAEGLLEGGNILVSAPTASGKTLLALLSIAKHFEEKKPGRIAYVVPLRALASEKFDEFTRAFPGRKVGVSTGEYDAPLSGLLEYDLVVMTSEKVDSVLRHDKEFARSVGLAIIDEVHLLDDEKRGATLEIVLTKLLAASCRLLCLSATIPNSSEIGGWLGAKVIKSDYRPTKLQLGLCDRLSLQFDDETAPERIDEKKFLEDLALKAVAGRPGSSGQALVFVATRPSAEAVAVDLSQGVGATLSEGERQKLSLLSKKAYNAFSRPTSQCAKLAQCIASGVAFHHAGIPEKQRRIIEEGFKKERAIKVISATTTLAMGIDYPASWVIVRDLKRFDGNSSSFISALEVRQMVGRAGRPRYDQAGYGVLCCSRREKRAVAEKYVYGPLEDIYSKLSSEPVLRVHCLALIASNYSNSFRALFEFFSRTYYAHHYGSTEQLFSKVEGMVFELERMGFVKETANAALVATPLGKRASELYLDPQTAHTFIQAFSALDFSNSLVFLSNLCNSTEMRSYLPVSREEEQKLFDEMYSFPGELYKDWESDAEAMQKYKTAKALDAWMGESSEQELLEKFNLPPGILNARVRIAEWLAYSFGELAKISGKAELAGRASRYRLRIKKGIKDELVGICRVKGIGRVRGRKLFGAGIKSREDYEAAGAQEIKSILGGKASRELSE